MEMNEIAEQMRQAFSEYLDVANLRPGNIVVIGCSTSEVHGGQHEYLAPYWQQCQCQFQYRKSKCLCQILPLPLLLPLVPQYRDNRRTAYHRYRNPDTHNRYQ